MSDLELLFDVDRRPEVEIRCKGCGGYLLALFRIDGRDIVVTDAEDIPHRITERPTPRLAPNGARLPANQGAWSANVLKGAIYSALKVRLGELSGPVAQVLSEAGRRSLSGGIKDEPRTVTQMLKETLDCLDGRGEQ